MVQYNGKTTLISKTGSFMVWYYYFIIQLGKGFLWNHCKKKNKDFFQNKNLNQNFI